MTEEEKLEKQLKQGIIGAVVIGSLCLILMISAIVASVVESKPLITKGKAQEVMVYEDKVKDIEGEQSNMHVVFDDSKGYLINDYIQVVNEKGTLNFYNSEGNKHILKARIEVLENNNNNVVIKEIETNTVRAGYIIEEIDIRGIEKGIYPARVSIVRVADNIEEMVEQIVIMIEIK